ncbi:MAG: HyaD/HybD family hydrogenase maturation endopeptidase [Planctomycetota bacterium]|jgi:hydrogenase maturation protease
MTRRALILGVGNVLLHDEGVGVHAVRRLEGMERPDGVDLLDGGTGGFHLLSVFDDYEHLVIIDAALDRDAPGTVRVRQPRFASDFPRVLSAHDIGLRDLIESASVLGPLPRMTLITVSVAMDQTMGTDLSPAVEAALPEVIREALRAVETPKSGQDSLSRS